MNLRRHRVPLAVAAVASTTVLAGCGFEGAQDIPLPGGEGMGDDAYTVTLEFPDVLDLVEQSAVKVNDVTVGSVDEIRLDGYTAQVDVRINGDVELPANVTASLRQTSLLGEKFVSFELPPEGERRGELQGGELLTLDRTDRSVEIEEVLSALSLVLNGGSIEQLQVINAELVNVLEGRETEIKDLLAQLETFVGGLDDQKADIVRALDSLDRLTARYAAERQTIATALQDIPPGVQVLTDQRTQITELLVALDDLGDVAVRVIQGSQEATVESLQALQPILENLNEAGQDLPEALDLLVTYPFPSTVDNGIKGDYANLFVTMDLDLEQLLAAETGTGPFAEDEQSEESPLPPNLPVQTPTSPPQVQVPEVPVLPLPGLDTTVPDVDINEVVPAPKTSGLGGLLDRLQTGTSLRGGGLLGLLVGGLQ